jgi:predicted transcriptional regulator
MQRVEQYGDLVTLAMRLCVRFQCIKTAFNQLIRPIGLHRREKDNLGHTFTE